MVDIRQLINQKSTKIQKISRLLKPVYGKHTQLAAISTQQKTNHTYCNKRQKATSRNKKQQGQDDCGRNKTETPKITWPIKGGLAQGKNIHNQSANHDGHPVDEETCDKDHCHFLFFVDSKINCL